MKQFIVLPDTSDWQLNPMEFIKGLRLRWPNIKIHEIANPESIDILRWTLEDNNQEISSGSLGRNKKTVVFDGTTEFIIEFAVWCRSIVPIEQELLFFDESYGTHFTLLPQMTREQIIAELEE